MLAELRVERLKHCFSRNGLQMAISTSSRTKARDGGILYRERDGALEPMAPREAEFGRPQWTFGMSTYAFESAERLICCFLEDGKWNLAKLDTRTKRFDPIPTRFTDVSQLRASPGRAAFIGGTPTEPPALIDLDLSTGTDRVVRRSAQLNEEVRSCVSTPELITFTTQGGETAHAFFYPPFSHKFTAPQGEKTPVLVKSHGGPTASASSTLSLAVQFWTSRGIGVLDVNYRGSTGYGRSYRLRLKQQWGIFDVQDCTCGARYLTANRNADPDRLMISGGSAGGYTTLCALTPEHEITFRAGASYYGVSDLLRSRAIRTNSSLTIWIGWSDPTRRNIRLMSIALRLITLIGCRCRLSSFKARRTRLSLRTKRNLWLLV